MTHFARLAASTMAVVLLGLAGCSSPSVVREGSDSRQVEGLYRYGAGDRDLALIVRGNPFDVPQETLDAAVEHGLDGGGVLQPPTHPRLAPGPSARKGYSLVVDFSGIVQDPCAPSDSVVVPAQRGSVDLEAAFCVSGQAVRRVRGHTVVAGPEAPDFQSLMHQVASELFRPDEYQGGNGGDSTSP